MTLQERLGAAVVALRKKYGVSQSDFAARSGVDRRYMSDVENGKRNPSLDVIARIADCFGISVSELFRIAEDIENERTLDSLKEELCNRDMDDAVVFESPDFLSAVIGYTEDGRVAYSYKRMIEHLSDAQTSPEDAEDFISYNTIRALPYMGNKAPVVVYDLDD